MSTFFDMNCGGETVAIEKTDDGDFIFHGWDEETELAAIELGFKPSACWVVWNAINNDMLDDELVQQASDGNALYVDALIRAGASVDARNIMDATPLHKAVRLHNTDVAKILLKAGSNVRAKDRNDWTPLHYAAAHGATDAVKILLEVGSSVDAEDRNGWTPLHAAARWGHTAITKVLLKAGASSTKAELRSRWTPLHVAAVYGHADVAKVLLEAGANVSAKDYDGFTPRQNASLLGKTKVHKIIDDWIAEHGE